MILEDLRYSKLLYFTMLYDIVRSNWMGRTYRVKENNFK